MRYIRGMVNAAVRRGLSPEQVLGLGGGISMEMLEVPRARVSLKQFSRLFGAVSQFLEDEGAGLSACAIPLGGVETMCRAGMTTNTLIECAETLAKGSNAVLYAFKVSFSADQHGIHITLHEIVPQEGDRNSTYEAILLTLYAVFSWLFGLRLPLVSVDFPCAAPRHLFEVRALFAGRVRFNQPAGALHFSANLGALRVVRSPGEIPKFLRRAPGSLIEALLTTGRLTVEVRRRIHAALPKLLTLDDVSRQLALSPRTLHRKLDAEGESFQKIKDELRRDIAIHALTRTNTPIKQISTDLGFADQASFQRAFAEWTGRPPGTWRRISAPAR
ncbi:AraC family transcriptional regulator [Rugamonas apoptosis]|uniref:AraC family transcriptional regulator ligand-binding domain-containing protein n=1 Tax=Rugamonas apoptosis TaxID=2758570 RepID=A0A7W2F7V6_9BURK|nr:AraC family transcriptional regulator [Rugamonas apoptosis]MBA5686679.1 AraC family transcriptional regulator ligand-binding domain-containing protein [Rugamonas apoptosis]